MKLLWEAVRKYESNLANTKMAWRLRLREARIEKKTPLRGQAQALADNGGFKYY